MPGAVLLRRLTLFCVPLAAHRKGQRSHSSFRYVGVRLVDVIANVIALIFLPSTDRILHVVLQLTPAFDQDLPQVGISLMTIESTNACSALCTVVHTVRVSIPRNVPTQEH